MDLLSLDLMYVKKITSFCQVLKKMHAKEDWFVFSASRCRMRLDDERAVVYLDPNQTRAYFPRRDS